MITGWKEIWMCSVRYRRHPWPLQSRTLHPHQKPGSCRSAWKSIWPHRPMKTHLVPQTNENLRTEDPSVFFFSSLIPSIFLQFSTDGIAPRKRKLKISERVPVPQEWDGLWPDTSRVPHHTVCSSNRKGRHTWNSFVEIKGILTSHWFRRECAS